MPADYSSKKLEEVVRHALGFLPLADSSESKESYRIIAYCSERISQVPFCIGTALTLRDEAQKTNLITSVLENLNFLNGVVGRLAHLEGRTMESASYSQFDIPTGGNYVDLFLERLGYVPPRK